MYVCAFLYVCAWRACCHKVSIQEKHSSSTTAGAVFQVVAAVYVCVVGEQQEIEPRKQNKFRVQCNSQTHIVGPHTMHAKHTPASAKAVAHFLSRFLICFVIGRNDPHEHYWEGCVLSSRLPRGIELNPLRRRTLYHIRGVI